MHQPSNAGAGFFAMLEMIARTPDQLLEYDTSLKAQRDAEARISYAQQAGIEIGFEPGQDVFAGGQLGADFGIPVRRQAVLGIVLSGRFDAGLGILFRGHRGSIPEGAFA